MTPVAASAACAALLVGALPAPLFGAPLTCADALKKVEKQMADAGVRQPQLKIVPKNLAGSARVLASCENGTQRIVQRADAEPAAPKPGPAAEGRASAKAKR